jgi:hypothetical protein
MNHAENRIDDVEELFERSFLKIDTNRDGRIGFAEFRAWWLSD